MITFFVLQSVNGAKRNQDSLSSEFKNENDELRREFQYIRSSKKLWYLKNGIESSRGYES